MPQIEEFAPAKINLALHVTGQRADGYHLLDSLVCFAEHGDTVRVAPSDTLSLSLEGPFAKGLVAEGDNLVLRAARLLDPTRGAQITLTKRLPVSSGIGGGSSDAAAALRALSRLWQVPLPRTEDTACLGADVPVCLSGAGAGLTRMSGIGETLTSCGPAPALSLVLVNPGVAVPTPLVFRALTQKNNPAMTSMQQNGGQAGWLEWLAAQRNDLQPAAVAQVPVISEVLKALAGIPGCRLARMSGSGATCFGLFDSAPSLDAVRARHPEWWICETRVRP